MLHTVPLRTCQISCQAAMFRMPYQFRLMPNALQLHLRRLVDVLMQPVRSVMSICVVVVVVIRWFIPMKREGRTFQLACEYCECGRSSSSTNQQPIHCHSIGVNHILMILLSHGMTAIHAFIICSTQIFYVRPRRLWFL